MQLLFDALPMVIALSYFFLSLRKDRRTERQRALELEQIETTYLRQVEALRRVRSPDDQQEIEQLHTELDAANATLQRYRAERSERRGYR